MAKLDLDDREFSTGRVLTPFFPRCDARYRLKVTHLDLDWEGEAVAGYQVRFEVLSAEEGKKDPFFEPLAKVGDVYERQFLRVPKQAVQKKQPMFEFRLSLAAINGEEHYEEFRADEALTTLEKIVKAGKIDALPEIKLEVRAKRAKKTRDDGTPYINCDHVFRPVED